MSKRKMLERRVWDASADKSRLFSSIEAEDLVRDELDRLAWQIRKMKYRNVSGHATLGHNTVIDCVLALIQEAKH